MTRIAATLLLALLATPTWAQKQNADIENIGTRNVNKAGVGGRVPSLQEEIAIGTQMARELEQSVTLVSDPVIVEYINRVGQNVVRNSDVKSPVTIKVIDSRLLTATSLPGGFLYVHLGLILAADNEAELASVIAHGVAHIAARHVVEQQGRGPWLDLTPPPDTIGVGGLGGMVIQQALSIGVPLNSARFAGENEEEADWLGLQYLYKAGYDPQAMVTFFQKLQSREAEQKQKTSNLFPTTPSAANRIKQTERDIAQYLPARERSMVSTSEFQVVKARLAELIAGRK